MVASHNSIYITRNQSQKSSYDSGLLMEADVQALWRRRGSLDWPPRQIPSRNRCRPRAISLNSNLVSTHTTTNVSNDRVTIRGSLRSVSRNVHSSLEDCCPHRHTLSECIRSHDNSNSFCLRSEALLLAGCAYITSNDSALMIFAYTLPTLFPPNLR